ESTKRALDVPLHHLREVEPELGRALDALGREVLQTDEEALSAEGRLVAEVGDVLQGRGHLPELTGADLAGATTVGDGALEQGLRFRLGARGLEDLHRDVFDRARRTHGDLDHIAERVGDVVENSRELADATARACDLLEPGSGIARRR